jgi:D-3-phosphoglycerate dehydrogenase
VRIVVLDTGYASYEPEEAILGREGHTLEFFEGARLDVAGRLEFARDAAGVFTRWTPMGPSEFQALPDLKCLVRYGTGYDNVDVEAATERGIAICNVQGYASNSVSDHALALILACTRGLVLGCELVTRQFSVPPYPQIPELKDMTLGIVGLGRIGGTLCEKSRSLFRRTLACDPYIPKDRFAQLGAEERSFDALLETSDVVTIHCNLTEETRHMFDHGAFAKMSEGAILVNTARGPVVGEDALLEALNKGTVHAAGLDVLESEPPTIHQRALLAHPHVIVTGHYAWYSVPSQKDLQRRAASNMAAVLKGEVPNDCLNAEVFCANGDRAK